MTVDTDAEPWEDVVLDDHSLLETECIEHTDDGSVDDTSFDMPKRCSDIVPKSDFYSYEVRVIQKGGLFIIKIYKLSVCCIEYRAKNNTFQTRNVCGKFSM